MAQSCLTVGGPTLINYTTLFTSYKTRDRETIPTVFRLAATLSVPLSMCSRTTRHDEKKNKQTRNALWLFSYNDKRHWIIVRAACEEKKVIS